MDATAGRRDNGLPSPDWGALVDLDPRLSEALLSSLAAADVPAFVEPAAGSENWTRAAQHPTRPLDRLWVAPDRADAAREVVSTEVADLSALLAEAEPGATAHGFVQPVPRTAAVRVLTPPVLPDPPPRRAPSAPPVASGGPATPAAEPDHDEAWRQIVEGFGRQDDPAVPPWPVVEDVDPPKRVWTSRPERSGDEPPRRRRAADEAGALPDWVEPDALEDDGHYVPPPPPPVPRLAPQKLAAVAAVVAGVLLFFVPSLLDALQLSRGQVSGFGILLLVGGAAALVWLMRDAPPTDSGPDDGAVV